MAVGGSQEQHRRGPLVAAREADGRRLPRFPERGVHGLTAHQRGVGRPRQLDRDRVADRVLHRHDRGRPPSDEGRGRAREEVDAVGPGSLARVEHGQADRVVIAEQDTEVGGRQPVGGTRFVAQREDTLTQLLVEAAVTDEVEHVPRPVEQRELQVVPRPVLEPSDLDASVGHQRCERLVHAGPLGGEVELGKVGGSRHHGQDPQRRLHRERLLDLGELDVADDRAYGSTGRGTPPVDGRRGAPTGAPRPSGSRCGAGCAGAGAPVRPCRGCGRATTACHRRTGQSKSSAPSSLRAHRLDRWHRAGRADRARRSPRTMACRPARRGASAPGSTGSAASVEVSPAGDEITRTGVPPSPGAPIKIWNSSAALSTTATGLPHAALIVQARLRERAAPSRRWSC